MRAVELKLRRLGAGRVLYQLWHRPRAAIRRSVREGGPLEQWRTWRGRCAMERAAATLPPIDLPVDRGLVPIHFLSGSRFWYQTAFCIWTYAQHAGLLPRVVVHDDGSLTERQCATLSSLIPGIEFVDVDQAERRLAATLPADRFPELNRQWRHYVNIRKLIGVHLSEGGWKLVLDSDMLFHGPPHQLLDWQRAPASMLVMRDSLTSYGYALDVLADLVDGPIPERVNVGVTGLHSRHLAWERIEAWCRSLIGSQGDSYFLEQAIVAMLAAEHGFAFADPARYRLLSEGGAAPRDSVLCHYVDLAKALYFRNEWARALGGSP